MHREQRCVCDKKYNFNFEIRLIFLKNIIKNLRKFTQNEAKMFYCQFYSGCDFITLFLILKNMKHF